VTTAPYGAWGSPITPALVARAGRPLGSAAIAADGAVWWAEGRPEEGGRIVLMRRPRGGRPELVTPEGFYVRTRVHEYGGGAWHLAGPDLVLFTNFSDQRLHSQRLGEAPRPITPQPQAEAGLRYADFRLTPDGATVVCVREVHGSGEAENQIVSLPLDGGTEPTVLAAGRDFYASPRISADGGMLAWICWDHPNMPWDGTELWMASLAEPEEAILVAGGVEESIFQPEWGADGDLCFTSDRDGWWNLYRSGAGGVEQITTEQADLGHPQWTFDTSTYQLLEDGSVVFVRTDRGEERLCLLDPGTDALRDFGLPFRSFGRSPSLSVRGGEVASTASSPTSEPAVFVLDLAGGEIETVRSGSEEPIDAAYASTPRAIEFPTSGGATAHGFYYPPSNADFSGPKGDLPPLIVQSHGGPTSHTTPALDRELSFWTSRGIGVVDVNYRGSSGYGRSYRNALRGQWGIVDTDDCIAAARFLAASGEVDGGRLAIRGGSAGGYATLCALVFHDEFATGAGYYGVADTETLATDTHKFESRYLDSLIGPYPERADIYRERSPIHFVEQLKAPVILFQGLDDEVVPPSQTETMVKALKANGVPHASLYFEGEAHGFRKAETEIRCLEAELYFYGRILGFEPPDDPEPVEIDGLPAG
jgi:dipeptidyl aminopeptidase/acylaminoacyl peptidase